MKTVLDGNSTAALACKQINPDVFGFYPITPTSYVGEKFSKFVADGKVQTEFVTAESEHAAMSVCVGAAAAGGRAITATASQGLLLMSEVLWNAAGLRLPIVMVNGNRALSAPLSIHGDHSDAMAVRDAGWIQLFAENAQEVYDFMLCAPLIAEHEDVRTPIMVAMDCFQTTHTKMNVETLEDKVVQKFVGETKKKNPLLDIENPVSYGNFDRPEFYMEHKRAQLEGLIHSEKVTSDILGEFAKISGRGSSELVDVYGGDENEIAVVVLGSTAGTLRRTIDMLQAEGKKVSLVRPKMFRPFPNTELKEKLQNFDKVLVLDRLWTGGAKHGALFSEIASLFINEKESPVMKNAIYGLGGRETNYKDFAELIGRFDNLDEDMAEWVNLRGY